ncbi:MAG: tetratricopeptide repeat protein [Bacteroidota bacterium]|nr:tetratricopeptide repeat protein [Bacteroidota bacterium]
MQKLLSLLMVKMTLFNLKILHNKFSVFIALTTLLTFIPCAKSAGEKAEDGFYSVQIAAYKNLDGANAMIDSLKVQDLRLFCKSVIFKNEEWHCVLAGRYKSKQEALDAGQSLKEKGVIKDFLIREPVPPTIDPENRHIPILEKADSLNAKKNIPPDETVLKDRTEPQTESLLAHLNQKVWEKTAPKEQTGPQTAQTVDQRCGEASLCDVAIRDFKSERYEDALNKLKQIIQHKDFKDVEKESILRHIGDCYYFLGKKTDNKKYLLKAIDQYRNLIRDYPNSEKGDALITIYRLAKSYEYLNLYQEALVEFKDLNSRYPESEYISEAMFMMGKMYYRMGKFNRAIEKFKEYIKRFPDDVHTKDAYFGIGDCYSQIRQFNDADIWYDNALKKWPDLEKISKDNILKLGSFYLQAGKYDQALKTFFAFTKLFPEEKDSKDVLCKIARSLVGAKQLSPGSKMLGLVISKYPKSKEAQESAVIMADIGVRYPKTKVPMYIVYGMDCYKNEIKRYDNILKGVHDNKKEELLFLKGYALLEMGTYKKSFDIYRSLLSQFFYERYKEASEKNLILSASYLVNGYYSKKDYIAVCDLYFKSYKYGLFKYGNFDTLLKTGNSLKRIGLLTCAVENFRKMIDVFKEHEQIDKLLLNIAKIDYDRNHYDDAEKELKTLLKEQSHMGKKILINAKKLLGDIYYRKGFFEEAVCFYSEVLDFGEDVENIADVYRDYANSLKEMHLYPSAFTNYQKAVRICKDKHQKCSIPVLVDSYEGLGDYFYNEGRYQPAISMYKQSLDHIHEGAAAPRQWAIFNIGRGYMNLGNNSMAEKSFSSLIEEGKDEFWPNLVDNCIHDKNWTDKHSKYLVMLDVQ